MRNSLRLHKNINLQCTKLSRKQGHPTLKKLSHTVLVDELTLPLRSHAYSFTNTPSGPALKIYACGNNTQGALGVGHLNNVKIPERISLCKETKNIIEGIDS